MHETMMIADLLTKIQELASEAEAGRVTRVRVHIGALTGITKEHFREHWEMESPGTIAGGAVLEVKIIDDLNDPQAQHVILESIDVDD